MIVSPSLSSSSSSSNTNLRHQSKTIEIDTNPNHNQNHKHNHNHNHNHVNSSTVTVTKPQVKFRCLDNNNNNNDNININNGDTFVVPLQDKLCHTVNICRVVLDQIAWKKEHSVVEDRWGDWLCSPFGNHPIHGISRRLVFVSSVDRHPFDRMLLSVLSAVSLSIFVVLDLGKLANVFCLLVRRNKFQNDKYNDVP